MVFRGPVATEIVSSDFQLRLNGDKWKDAVIENRTLIIETVVVLLSQSIGVPREFIFVRSVVSGSLVVDFTVVRNATYSIPDRTIVEAINRTDYSPVATLYVNLTNSSAEEVFILSTTVTKAAVVTNTAISDVSASGGCAVGCIGAVVGGVLGGIIAIAVVAIIVCRQKMRKKDISSHDPFAAAKSQTPIDRRSKVPTAQATNNIASASPNWWLAADIDWNRTVAYQGSYSVTPPTHGNTLEGDREGTPVEMVFFDVNSTPQQSSNSSFVLGVDDNDWLPDFGDRRCLTSPTEAPQKAVASWASSGGAVISDDEVCFVRVDSPSLTASNVGNHGRSSRGRRSPFGAHSGNDTDNPEVESD